MKKSFDLEEETFFLQKQWSQYEHTLENYLTVGWQNPICNLQSILKRHFLIEALFGNKFQSLALEEIPFGIEINKLLKKEEESWQGIMLRESNSIILEKAVPKDKWTEFQNRWSKVLKSEKKKKIKILEPACGSANDFRFMPTYGLARFLDYKGFDLSSKNVENAKKISGSQFEVGNIFKIKEKNSSYDYLIISDLFEHFSYPAIEKSIKEIFRVAKKKIYINFFNIFQTSEHEIISKEFYHLNELSLMRMQELFRPFVKNIKIISIDELCIQHGFSETHNKNAYTFILEI